MLTALIAKYLGGRALKAVVGGATMTAVVGAATGGFTEGITPFANELGFQIGSAIGTFLIGYLPVYVARNKPDAK